MSIPITVSIVAFPVPGANTDNKIDTRVTPEVLNLPSLPFEGPTTIHFKIESVGYVFDDDGIKFGDDASGQIGPTWYSGDRREAMVENQNYSGLAYPYMVSVKSIDGRLKGMVDPVVQNDTR